MLTTNAASLCPLGYDPTPTYTQCMDASFAMSHAPHFYFPTNIPEVIWFDLHIYLPRRKSIVVAHFHLHMSSTSLAASKKSLSSKLIALLKIIKYVRISSCNNIHSHNRSSLVSTSHRFFMRYPLETFLCISRKGGATTTAYGFRSLLFSALLSNLLNWTQSSHR
mmetsp:Transcript_6835/g.12367  ORF Transcript_6835/g.12367 Transcript_6835/m.12367 type:complete len:165 (+) Transcript_6835:346-840(+)